jgi:hypothetical protein
MVKTKFVFHSKAGICSRNKLANWLSNINCQSRILEMMVAYEIDVEAYSIEEVSKPRIVNQLITQPKLLKRLTPIFVEEIVLKREVLTQKRFHPFIIWVFACRMNFENWQTYRLSNKPLSF